MPKPISHILHVTHDTDAMMKDKENHRTSNLRVTKKNVEMKMNEKLKKKKKKYTGVHEQVSKRQKTTKPR